LLGLQENLGKKTAKLRQLLRNIGKIMAFNNISNSSIKQSCHACSQIAVIVIFLFSSYSLYMAVFLIVGVLHSFYVS